ncbi:TRAP-type mannitol/chloroaromatic compound transport system, small permease component [Desulfocurvibacter africanus PCS]|uniref:TRAP-type mannitol/chloroaromatic compound transport system, small permease component n=1 Tax=Desulfocurvibacter africanus PCS TaxID=1262666 RepID=M5Q1N4_DESAF|nr:TRAP transporter small permease subunit [Desulfocurvibacter africanus]EMG36703.1 TRAP-type mannitol/chloroaromatic compound transport system, small permease component [Desulfocurvibacter africanus PCS]
MIRRVISIIDGFTERLGKIVMWLSLVLVLLVCADVAMRYLFSLSFTALRELEWYAYSLLFLLGAAYTLRHDAHVRVDVIYQYLSPRSRAAVNVAGCLLFLFPGCWLVIDTSMPFVEYSLQISESSSDPGGMPLLWPIKAAIPVGFALLALQGIAFLLRNALVLAGGAPKSHNSEA